MTGPPDTGDSGPRWPRDLWLSPTALKSYHECPHRVRLQYIDRIAAPYRFSVHLSMGRIAHLALKRIADALARSRPPINDDEVHAMARRHLPWQEFPSREAHEAHAKDIARWVAFGRQYIEQIPDAHWLLIERNQTRAWRILPGLSPYTLMARPDVILLRTDEGGTPLVEIIDYKTGQIRPDDDPPVLMRFVTRDLLAQVAGDASAAQVRFTWLWLDKGERTRIDLSVEHCNDHWQALSRHLRNLATETVWKATPSLHCRYCPYHRNVCTEEIPPDAGFLT